MSLDHHHDGADDDFDTPPAGPLNEEDIVWGVECAVSHVATRYVERVIREATDDATAAALAKEQCRWWGRTSHGESIHGENKGLDVRRDGRHGLITWIDVARRCRGTYAPPQPSDEQISLF